MKKITKRQLKDLIEREHYINKPLKSLHNRVISDLLYYSDSADIEGFISDILNHGLSSGIIGNLIYYKDTTAFYNKYKGDIWDIVIAQSEEMGYENPFEYLKNCNSSIGSCNTFENFMTWLGYEETVRKIADALDIEI